MRRITRKLILLAAVVAAFAAMQGAALAAPPDDSPSHRDGGGFLCPAVGDGVLNAAGIDAFELDNGLVSFLPAGGDNQAGAKANSSVQNEQGPGDPELLLPGGGNSGWSPIWPAG